MSALAQLTHRPEQPGVPAPSVPYTDATYRLSMDIPMQPGLVTRHELYPVGTLASEQPTQDVGSPLGGGLFQSIGCHGFNWEGQPDSTLEGLEDEYVIDNRSAVAAFIIQNRIRGLLLQAREPLNAAFGKGPLKKLTLVTDDEGSKTLFCLVRVPGDMQEARRALRSFDQRWWLGRSTQAAAKLNFDFELV